MKNVHENEIGNFFTERQLLVSTSRKGDNYYPRVLEPYAKYILENEDTSNYRQLDSDLTKYLYDASRKSRDIKGFHDLYWENASSIPRILPIIYFDKIDNKEYIRLTKIAELHYKQEITSKEFLLLWVLRFQGPEFSEKGVLTKSTRSIEENCCDGRYKKLIKKRVVKPALLALQIMAKAKNKGHMSITDKQFRHARRLIDQQDMEAVDGIVELVISGESNYSSQEQQIFKILEYLGLCSIKANETNNDRYYITGLGVEVAKKVEEFEFTYYHKTNSTAGYIEYIGDEPNYYEKEIIKIYKKYGGDL